MRKNQKFIMKPGNKFSVWYGALLAVSSLLMMNCSGTRKIPAGQYLYTGSNIAVESAGRIPNRKELASALDELVRPEPNGSIFGMRPRVWIYNITADTVPQKGLKRWLHRKIGERPVLLSEANPANTRSLIQNRLYNSGYFQADVDYDVIMKKRTAHINYRAGILSPYTIDSVSYPTGKSTLRMAIDSLQESSSLEKGSPYNVDSLISERERISAGVRDLGFYYFAPGHLVYRVDSAIGDRQVRIWLNLKDSAPAQAFRQYRLGEIVVNPNYSFALDSSRQGADTVLIEGYRYINNLPDIKSKVVLGSIFLKPDSIYSRRAHEQTLNRLMGLGVFQYGNVRFENMGRDSLRAFIQTTPVKKKSIRMELQGITSSYYLGPNVNVTFQNRNFLGGAELLELRLNASLELATGDERNNLNAYSFGGDINLYFPRYVVPFFKVGNESSFYVPKTRLRFGYQRINRFDLFQVNSFSLGAGYLWNETRSKSHELNIIDINFFQLADTTARFHRLLQQNEFLRRSYSEQFILSSNYSYTYNNQRQSNLTHNFFFNGQVDVSGNLMNLLQSAFNEEVSTAEEPYTIFGTPYSQYSKLSADLRYYYSIDRENRIATRLFVGAGFPYENSTSLPFIKQFFVGGPNSLRAFEARSIGPGVSIPTETEAGFFDQLGDMRIEGNIEYRFPIYSVFKGAIFLDAGNIWMVSKDFGPESRFNINRFTNELAVGTGFGLRLDVDFFVLRFDLGVPLRVPQGWVWDNLSQNVDARWNDFAFNIAIGYPF